MPSLTLLDWKSGGYRDLTEHLQLAGYFGATHRWEPDALTWVPMTERVSQAGIVRTWEGGCRVETLLSLADLETTYQKFLSLYDVFMWMVAKGKVSIPENEAYRVNGRYYPSVTYILSQVIAKPALLNWSYEGGVMAGLQADSAGCTPEEIAQAIAVKTRLEDKSMKRTDPDAKAWFDVTAKLHEAGLSTNAKRDGRAGQGTSIHKNILFYLQGKPVSVGEAPEWLSKALTHFAAWAGKVDLKAAYLEQKVMNDDFGWAGTCDFMGWANLPNMGIVEAKEEASHVAS